jgi:CheY-like chemotaxis protein
LARTTELRLEASKASFPPIVLFFSFSADHPPHNVWRQKIRNFGAASPENRSLTGMSGHQRILILDDEQDLLEIYQEILARLPSQPDIKTARSGHEAMSMLEMEPFDLLLVDINMPQMDGFQVLAIVRRRFPSLRTVMITAASDEDYRARAYSIGVDLYIENALEKL